MASLFIGGYLREALPGVVGGGEGRRKEDYHGPGVRRLVIVLLGFFVRFYGRAQYGEQGWMFLL